MLHLFFSTVYRLAWFVPRKDNSLFYFQGSKKKNNEGRRVFTVVAKSEYFGVDFGGRCDRNCQIHKRVLELMLSS